MKPRKQEIAFFSDMALGCVRFFQLMAKTLLLTCLAILEPFVCFILSGLAVLGVVVAIALEASALGTTFPFWGMIAFSLGIAMLLAAYRGAMNVLSR